MSNLAEYFEKHRPKPVWHIGDRVFGHWNKIPFVGTVGNDTMISELEGPRVSVFLDLPIVFEDKIHSVIIVKQKQIKRLMSMDDTRPLKPQEAGSIPVKRTKQNDSRRTNQGKGKSRRT